MRFPVRRRGHGLRASSSLWLCCEGGGAQGLPHLESTLALTGGSKVFENISGHHAHNKARCTNAQIL